MQNFVRFLHEIRGYWRLLLIIALLTLVNSAMSLPPPLILRYLTDNFQQHRHVNLPGVFLVVVGLALGSALFGYWLTYSITLLGQRFKFEMRRLYGTARPFPSPITVSPCA